jgi:predicted nucleic acid-binding protein
MTSIMPDAPTVSNSSCLIGLEAVGHLDILQQLYTTIEVPEAVAQEFGSALPTWAQVHAVQNRSLVQSLRLGLGAGEAEAIALSVECAAARLILDDKKARRIARQLQQPVTGTLAVLLRAKDQGILSNVRDIIDALAAANFRVSDVLVQEVLRQAGE